MIHKSQVDLLFGLRSLIEKIESMPPDYIVESAHAYTYVKGKSIYLSPESFKRKFAGQEVARDTNRFSKAADDVTYYCWHSGEGAPPIQETSTYTIPPQPAATGATT